MLIFVTRIHHEVVVMIQSWKSRIDSAISSLEPHCSDFYRKIFGLHNLVVWHLRVESVQCSLAVSEVIVSATVPIYMV